MPNEFSMISILWIVLLIVFVIMEGIAPGLVCIWFALGSLVALILSLFNTAFWVQVLAFLAVSALSLALTRKRAKKYVNGRRQATNADMHIGQECPVKETIDNLNNTGAVAVGGKVWSARSAQPDVIIQEGAIAVVERIEGVKLVVTKK